MENNNNEKVTIVDIMALLILACVYIFGYFAGLFKI